MIWRLNYRRICKLPKKKSNKKGYKLVIIDTETGGLDPSVHSLLSVGLVLVDSGSIVEQKLWNVAEPAEMVNCTEEALKVNQINLDEHLKNGTNVANVLMELERSIPDSFMVDGGKAIFTGHNVKFDVGFIDRLGRIGGSDKFVDRIFGYRHLDTVSILMFLNMLGLYGGKSYSLSTA